MNKFDKGSILRLKKYPNNLIVVVRKPKLNKDLVLVFKALSLNTNEISEYVLDYNEDIWEQVLLTVYSTEVYDD